MRRLAVLLTCHNRKPQTVACLKALDASVRHYGAARYHAFITDDGSTDGTAEAIQSLGIPVTILQGGGDLFWNRGMVNSWKAADEDPDGFDGYLLLNDDTLVDEDAMARLMSTLEEYSKPCVVVGAVRHPTSGRVTYGGVVRVSSWHPGRTKKLGPSAYSQPADTFNANCVYVPKSVAEVVGTLDPLFHHSMGDFDYGYRARKLGFDVFVAPSTVGTCKANAIHGSWRDSTLRLTPRLKALRSPKGLPFTEWREFLRRHGAPFPTLLATAPYVAVVASSLLDLVRRRGRA